MSGARVRRAVERLARVQTRPLRTRLGLVGGAVVAYAMVVIPSFAAFGAASLTIDVIPVVVAGWLLGTRWGLAVGILIFPLNLALSAWAGLAIDGYLRGLLPALLAFSVIGGAVGALRDLGLEFRAKQERLRRLIASAPVVLFAVDASGLVTFEDGKALKRIGLRPGENVGKNFFDVYAARPEVVELMRRALRGEDVSRVFGGPDLAYEVHYSPVREGSHIVGAIGVASDVTERAAAEARFQRFFELNPLPSSITRLSDGEIVDVNTAFLETFGLSRDAVLGRTTTDLGLWADPADRRRLAETIEQEGSVRNLEFRARTKTGEERLLLGSWSLMDLGGVPHIVGSRLDVTERRLAEERLRASEAGFAAMFRQNPAGLLLSRLSDGVVLDVNEAMLRMSGYGRSEIVGRRLSELDVWMDAVSRRAVREWMMRDVDIHDHEFSVRLKSGEVREVLASFERIDFGGERCALTSAIDITARKHAERALEQRALHDDLTGLPNRVLLHDRLAQTIHAARRQHGGVALIVMDLDHFKEVNDTFGHHAGDELLRQVGPRLVGELRESDSVARLGGDEFALILPGANPAGAKQVARSVLESLRRPFVVEGQALHIEASIGIAVHPQHGDDPETLLRRADIAMYVAKRSRSAFFEYSPEEDEHTPERLALLGDLGEAIERDQLVLHFHPEVSLRTGRVIGMEALVRWQHPERGLLRPEQFIPLAERTGLMKPLTLWVLRRALASCRDWQGRWGPLRVAVNLSARSLVDPDLPDAVGAFLEEADVPPRLLSLEITESVIMTDPRRALETLARLRRMGVRLSIDDFGTGYSSLGYLHELAVHQVKIDQSFVRSMRVDRGSAAIVRATVELGHSLGFEVVAEGVEDRETVELLAGLGSDLVQGYHIALPMPDLEVAAWLSSYERVPRLVSRVPA